MEEGREQQENQAETNQPVNLEAVEVRLMKPENNLKKRNAA